MASRDWDVLLDITARLQSTQEFDGVYRSAEPEARGQAASDRFAAVVAPLDWEETDESDDPTSVQSTRKVRWKLTLLVREDDPEMRERALDRLLNVAQTTLDGQCLAGITIPDWTRLRRGSYEAPENPSQKMNVVGEFAYWIDGFGGHDISA